MRKRVVRPLDVSPRALAVAMIVLAAATELKFRQRDASLALQAAFDAQILAELAVWGLVFGWLLVVAIRRRRKIISPFLPIGVHSTVRIIWLISIVAVAWSFLAPSPLSIVRALQFAAMTTLGITTFHRLRGDREGTVEYWQTWRRALWAVIVVSVLGTIVINGASVPEFEGETRYAWFAVHPISTGNIIGMGLILAVGTAFHVAEPLTERRLYLAGGAAVAALCAVLLLLTKARGSLAATVAGVVVLVVLSRRKQMRLAALLMVLCGVGALLAGLGDDAILSALQRGATTAELKTLTGRTELFRIAFGLFLESPIIGYGFLAGRSVFLEAVPWAGHAHNLLAEIAISFGAVGLLLYGALAIRLLNVLRLTRRRRPSVEAAIVWEAAGLLGFIAVAGIVGSGAASIPGFEYAALLTAVVVADLWVARPREEDNPVQPRPLVQPSSARPYADNSSS